jgi:ketosteroid isomerase-like protein
MRTNIHSPMQISCHHRSVLSPQGWLAGRVLLLGGVLCIGIQLPAWAASLPFSHHDNASSHKEIEGLEQDWRSATLSSNLTELDHLLADDYLGVTANGTLETKADLLAMRRSGTTRFSQLNLTDLKVRVYGDTAVVTSRAEVSGTNGGTDISGRYRYTRVYNRRNGQWRIVSFEASRIADNDHGKR